MELGENLTTGEREREGGGRERERDPERVSTTVPLHPTVYEVSVEH
jgi:hypothetical protein